MIPLFPDIRELLSRDAYKKEQKDLKKASNIFTVVYIIGMLLFIAYIIYRYV